MKVTIEMDYAEFNEYQSMRDKIDDPNYVDITQTPIQDILLKKGFNKGIAYTTNKNDIDRKIVEAVSYKRLVDPNVECEIVIKYISKF